MSNGTGYCSNGYQAQYSQLPPGQQLSCDDLSQQIASNVQNGSAPVDSVPQSSSQSGPLGNNALRASIQGRESFYESDDKNSGLSTCEPGSPAQINTTPCCVTGLELAKGNRKVTLPIDPQWGDELYVLATEEERGVLYAEVTSTVIGGRSCAKGRRGFPVAVLQTPDKTEQDSSVNGRVYAVEKGFLSGNSFVQLLKFVYHLVFSEGEPHGSASSHLLMCETNSELAKTLRARAFLPAELEGKIWMELSAQAGTGGSEGTIQFGGSIEGKIGRQKIPKLEKKSKNLGSGAKPKNEDVGDQGFGFLGIVFDVLVSSAPKDAKFKEDVSTGSSFVKITHRNELSLARFSLKEDDSGPGIILNIEGLTVAWKPFLSLTGHLDIIDAVLNTVATPAMATAVRKIRAAVAAGEKISGKIEAYLEFTGEINLSCGIQSDLILFSPLEHQKAKRKLKPNFLGGGKVTGIGKVAISLRAEIWKVDFDTGIDASLHTSFLFELKEEGDGAKYRRGFEGLYGTVKYHIKIGIAKKKEGKDSETEPEAPDQKTLANKAIINPSADLEKWLPFRI